MKVVENVVSLIVRPTRQKYSPLDLGPSHFKMQQKQRNHTTQFERKDYGIKNSKGKMLQLSYYFQVNRYFGIRSRTCILHLHGNCSSRLESIHYKNDILIEGFSFCSFDFSGSGNSEGQCSGAGLWEASDISAVVDFLVQNIGVEEIVIWGRSMGAVAAIMYSIQIHSKVACLILDSPYSDLSLLIKQQIGLRTKIPAMLAQPLIKLVKSSLKEKHNLDLDHFTVSRYFTQTVMDIPALFIASKKDSIVNFHHSEKLFTDYPSTNKHLMVINSDHNQTRSANIVEEILEWIRRNQRKNMKKVSLSELVAQIKSNSDHKHQNDAFYKFSLSRARSTFAEKNGQISLSK